MTARNLDALFHPRRIALIGASAREGSVGAALAHNLATAGFAGEIVIVHPGGGALAGRETVASVGEITGGVDLGVIATPAHSVAGLVAELSRIGARAAVVISGGFGGEGPPVQALLDAARPTTLRILGPNGLGFLSPVSGVNASFAHLTPKVGNLALLSQSGAVAAATLDWAAGRGIGFSHVLSLGDMADIDFGDLLDFIAADAKTAAVLMYVETITHARKFMSAARACAREKPVIVIKSGVSQAGARAAATHTGALAGADRVYDAAFRRAGLLRVAGVRDLFDAAEMLARGFRAKNETLAILTNGGGLGVMAADALERGAAKLAVLSGPLLAALDPVMPKAWSRANPMDIIGDAGPGRYSAALEALLRDEGLGGVLLMHCPTGVTESGAVADMLIALHTESPKTPVLACFVGEETARPARAKLSAAGVPTYETPDEATDAFTRLVAYGQTQQALLETPRAAPALPAGAHEEVSAIIAAALGEGRTLLNEWEAKAVLARYGVPTVPTLKAEDPQAVFAAAEKIGEPVVVKILSRDLTHKSDIGGVRLDLATAKEAEAAAAAMLTAIKEKAPHARLEGFTVQAMVRRKRALELFIGAHTDPTFGPVIVFGQGGTSVEAVDDTSLGLPPLTPLLARDMISRTRIKRLMAGYRDVAPVKAGLVEDALIAVSALISCHSEIVGLDINPLLADAAGVIALDARVEIAPGSDHPAARLAILPYPEELESEAVVGAARFALAPARPENAAAIANFLEKSTEASYFLPIGAAASAPTPALAKRLSQLDYDRELTLLAWAGDGAVGGLLRLAFDPDFTAARMGVSAQEALAASLTSWAMGHALARGALVLSADIRADARAARAMLAAKGAHAQELGDIIRMRIDLR